MVRFEMVYALHRYLMQHRYATPAMRIQKELHCSSATFYRVVKFMRDKLAAPILCDRKYKGYRYDLADAETYELPGLWFSGEELAALISLENILREMHADILQEQFAPLREKLTKLLNENEIPLSNWENRIRLLPMGTRKIGEGIFKSIAEGVLLRKQLKLNYIRGSDGTATLRTVCPQSLVRYRDNWYLDAWCHFRQGLRSFALNRITGVEVLKSKARSEDKNILQDHFTESYGIFAGKAKHIAELIFHKTAARFVSQEQWHPKQIGEWLADGSYRLKLPFGDERELLMDILRYGDEVEVVDPLFLRAKVLGTLKAAAKKYV